MGVYIYIGGRHNSGYEPYVAGAIERDGMMVVY
jgi:hypothetical protein